LIGLSRHVKLCTNCRPEQASDVRKHRNNCETTFGRRGALQVMCSTGQVRRYVVCQLLLIALIAAGCNDSTTNRTEPSTSEPSTSEPSASEPSTAEPGTNSSAGTSEETATATSTPVPPADGPRVKADVDLASVPAGEQRDFGLRPDVPTGELAPEVLDAVDVLLGQRLLDRIIDELSFDAIETIAESGDPRVSWWLADLQRIANNPELSDALRAAQETLLGVDIDPLRSWGSTTDQLIGWDIPAPPNYLAYKRNVYIVIEPKWEPLFEDGTDIDWRILSWGGVFIDDRPFGETDNPCNCIPAADNPITTNSAGGDEWLDEDTIVFGVSINGDSRAYPRSIMEVREMVNDTLGGRDFAMPYCTLCGSAQVYFTDEIADGIARPVLRTSGLLSRSNKVMYDVNTFSIFDTFLGKAVSGPLLDAGVELDQHSVVTTTWGRWKVDHPETDVLDITLANGRPQSDLRNTRDGDGPIFPIGQVDDRLPVQEDVLGVLTASGDPVAFHVNSALAALERGEFIEVDGINLILDGGGVRAIDSDGNDLGGHQAFWFAWSQFYPNTDLWPM